MKREKKKEQTASTLSVKREKATSILFLSAMLLFPAPTWAQHSMTGTQQTVGKPTYQARAITGTVTTTAESRSSALPSESKAPDSVLSQTLTVTTPSA